MTKITQFTRANLQQARQAGFIRAAEEAVAKIAAEHGLSFHFGNAKFDDLKVELKAEFKVADPAKNEAKERESFAYGCAIFSKLALRPSDYGAFLGNHNGEDVFLVGFNVKRPKYALMGRTATGKVVNFTEGAARGVVLRRQQAAQTAA